MPHSSVAKSPKTLWWSKAKALPCSKRSHSSHSRGKQACGVLPAMTAALMAPIEVPITQSGSMPASCSASYTPTW